MRLATARALSAALIALALAPIAARAQTPAPSPTPAPYASDERPLFVAPHSVADPYGADAIVFNPAALKLEPDGELVLIHADGRDRDRPGNGNALYLKSGLLNMAVEWGRPAREIDHTLFTFGSGIPIGRATAIGLSYATSFGDDLSNLDYKNWTLGYLTRPSRFFSLGGTMWNANGTKNTPGFDLRPRYAGGLAIRPLGSDRFTIAGDVAKTDGQDGEDIRWSMRVEPAPGLGIFATADDAERWTAGLSFQFTYGDVGSHAFRDHDGEFAGSSTRIRMSERRRHTSLRGPAYARVVVDGPLPDRSQPGFGRDQETTLPDVLVVLATVRRDPTVDGALIRIDGAGSGLATAQELRDAIARTRAAKKKVFCWFDNADIRMYYVAAACDRVAMHPTGFVSIEGLFTGLGYMKGTLDKAGIEVEAIRAGEYKGAPEPFLQTEPSKETLEVTNALLDGSFEQIVAGIAEGRGMDPARVRELIDEAFFDSKRALEAKLVDYAFYPDELEDEAKDFLGRRFALVRGYRGVAPRPAEWGRPPRIAVVYASGAITEGESSDGGLFGDPVLGSRTIVRALRAAKDDGSVKAVVLRVDSPGGSGFASDQIWHEVLEVKKRKPVVVSMGDVAASGGYYVSMGANEIFASPGTITGSIGVFFIKPSLAGLYGKLDYNRYDFSRGRYAGMFTEARPFTEEERAVGERLIGDFYQDFIAKAAKGRNTTPEAIDAVGRGHVWLGSQARERKLVDTFGGLEAAVDRAKELAKIPKRRRVEWLELPRARGFWEELGRAQQPPELKALEKVPFREALAQAELLRALGPGVMAWQPWEPRWHTSRPETTRAGEPQDRGWWPVPVLREAVGAGGGEDQTRP